ncbi:lanC-like protein 3 homolog [Toxorhynchites rutilus septentrionalis]|uniref:lanC-like protein 3 homolog n=1 Tax=Toxorhynchites rutilus septentrionalis TaxID=329112 RepID=UPI00247988E8|nr:lanC-like protein 3 homolog [Toxorhynchites rutilus septentrionalis]
MSDRFFVNRFEDYNSIKYGPELLDLIHKDVAIRLVKDYVAKILAGSKKSNYKLRDDLYVGEAGIAFMFWKLSRSDDFKGLFPCLEHASWYIKRAKEISAAKRKDDESRAAFLCGNAGISAVSAVISHDLDKRNSVSQDIMDFRKGHVVCMSNSYTDDEVLVGRAGYLSGAYWLNQILPFKPISNNTIEDICEILMKRGRTYSRSRNLSFPLMYEYHGSDYLGAAHGLCSILHMLLESPWFAVNDTKEQDYSDIKASVDYFLGIQDENGNFPTRLLNSNKNLIHWCHGCSGAIYMLAKAYLVFKEEKYLAGCRKCAESIWREGLLRKGPGICHGISGNGYAFLLMFRLTGENVYLYRAGKFMEFLDSDIFVKAARTPDRPLSLYEGMAGAVCFIVDLLSPATSHFPFMDVFYRKYCE